MITKMSKVTANLGYYNLLRDSQQAPEVAKAPEPNVPVKRACRSSLMKTETVDTADKDTVSTGDGGTLYLDGPYTASKHMLDIDLMIEDDITSLA